MPTGSHWQMLAFGGGRVRFPRAPEAYPCSVDGPTRAYILVVLCRLRGFIKREHMKLCRKVEGRKEGGITERREREV